MTKAECLLWQYLRKRRLCAHKFRRQHALGYYILDFYCHELKLVIELDGNQHLEENQREYDMQRSVVLANLGISVLRFRNYQALNNIEAVLKIIESYISKAMPTPQPLSHVKNDDFPLPLGEDARRAGEGGSTAESVTPRDNDSPTYKFLAHALR
jgi:very-short-patch-repair endonuclease